MEKKEKSREQWHETSGRRGGISGINSDLRVGAYDGSFYRMLAVLVNGCAGGVFLLLRDLGSDHRDLDPVGLWLTLTIDQADQ